MTLYASLDTTITGTFERSFTPDVLLASRFINGLQPGQCDTAAARAFAPWFTGAFHLGAIVDEGGWVSELIEANNRTTGPLIGFGNGPDLVVTSIAGPASANGAFEITSTVCNQGTQPSFGSAVQFYASADTTITGSFEAAFSPDVVIGSRFIGGLQPGQCDTGATPGFAPPRTGAFYLGAIVDEGNGVAELLEANNHTTGPLIGFGDGPDLVVTSITGPPTASGAFDITSTVCNLGTQWSDNTQVQLYVSADTTITGSFEGRFSPDVVVASRSVTPLAPGQCETGVTTASTPGTTGVFYLGAIVDELRTVAELIESNNHVTGPLIGVGDAPDLVVTSITGPASANGVFDITATVCNQGTQPSNGTEVTLYASLDAAITGALERSFGADVILGSRFINALQPGQCEAGATSVFASWLTGAFYLGAIIDEGAAVAELIESNNHTAGPLIGLGNAADLVVTSITGPPSANGAFELASTICNQGTQMSDGVQVQLYASTDAAIVGASENPFASDILLASRFVGALRPGQCDAGTALAFAPPQLGALYLGAIVDETNASFELIESNNHTTGSLIGFGNAPDFVVTAISAPASASAAFDITSTICNRGTQFGGGVTVQLYASVDTTITGSFESTWNADIFLGSRFVGGLQPGQCETAATSGFAPPQSGALYLGAIIDQDNAAFELIESNNRTTGPLIGFGNAPDLIVTAISGPPSVSGAFSITSTVCNQGTQPSGSSQVTYYVSADAVITGSVEGPLALDVFVGSRTVGELLPGACDTSSTSAFMPPATGPFYLGAIADENRAITELIEANNHTTGPLISVGNGPDLVVASITGPASAETWFDLAATVCNQGTLPSGGFDVMFYASTDTTITGLFESWGNVDSFIGSRFIASLQPGQCDATPLAAFVPAQGGFYLGAIVDESGGIPELLESNNHTTGPQIGFGSAPDLVVTEIAGPPTASGWFEISTTVCNQGTQPSFGFEVMLYVSADTTITGIFENWINVDMFVGSRFVDSLAPGQCDTALTGVFAPAFGAFYLGATVDEGRAIFELIESNNHTTGPVIGLGQ